MDWQPHWFGPAEPLAPQAPQTAGRTPLPQDPAYQQVLKGIPTNDYSRDELLYLPPNPRSHKVYGLSRNIIATGRHRYH